MHKTVFFLVKFSSIQIIIYFLSIYLFKFIYFETEMGEGQREREGEREKDDPKQAPRYQRRARREAGTHQL